MKIKYNSKLDECTHRKTYPISINVEKNGKHVEINWQNKCKNCGTWIGDPYKIKYKEV